MTLCSGCECSAHVTSTATASCGGTLQRSSAQLACSTSQSHHLRHTFHRTLCLLVDTRCLTELKTEVFAVSLRFTQHFAQVIIGGKMFLSLNPLSSSACSCSLWKLKVHCSKECCACEVGFRLTDQTFEG